MHGKVPSKLFASLAQTIASVARVPSHVIKNSSTKACFFARDSVLSHAVVNSGFCLLRTQHSLHRVIQGADGDENLIDPTKIDFDALRRDSSTISCDSFKVSMRRSNARNRV